jgi:hypothetical protein
MHMCWEAGARGGEGCGCGCGCGEVGGAHKSLGCQERAGNDRPKRLVLLKMLCLLLYSMTTSGLKKDTKCLRLPWNKYLKSAIKTRGSKITHVAKESCMPCSWALNTRMDKGTHTEQHVGRHLRFPIVTQKDVSQVWSCPHPTLGGPPQGSDLWGSPLYLSSSSPVPHRLEILIFAQELS